MMLKAEVLGEIEVGVEMQIGITTNHDASRLRRPCACMRAGRSPATRRCWNPRGPPCVHGGSRGTRAG
jgi:hypothetical protein